MFSLLGPSRRANCDGSTRRDFLKVGALGLGGLLLPDLLRARAAAAADGKSVRNASVVFHRGRLRGHRVRDAEVARSAQTT